MPCHQAATALCAVNITGHAELLPPSPHVLTAANNPRPSPSPTPQPPSTLNNSGDVVIMNHLQPIAAWFVEQCQDSVHISGEIGAKAVVAGLQLAPLLSIKPLPCVFTTYGSKLGENWRILKRETVNVDSTLVKFETTALTEAVFTEMGAGEDEDCFDFQGELSCPNIQISSESPLSWLSTGGQTKARTTSLQRCLTMASSPCSSAWWEDMSGVPLSSGRSTVFLYKPDCFMNSPQFRCVGRRAIFRLSIYGWKAWMRMLFTVEYRDTALSLFLKIR